MIQRVKLGTVPVGAGRRLLEVCRCQLEQDRWVEVHDRIGDVDYVDTDTYLLTAQEARALAALLVQAAQDPGPEPPP